MATLNDAQELLSADEFTTFQSLAVKVAQFNSTATEDEEFFNLKDKVGTLVAQRDKEKNLEFLSGGHFTIGEVIRVMFKGKEDKAKAEVIKGLKEAFPGLAPPPKEKVHIANYKVAGVEKPLYMFGGIASRDDALKAVVIAGGVAELAKNLTKEGKEWIAEFNIPKQGQYKDIINHKNLKDVAKKFDFKVDELKKALKIKD